MSTPIIGGVTFNGSMSEPYTFINMFSSTYGRRCPDYQSQSVVLAGRYRFHHIMLGTRSAHDAWAGILLLGPRTKKIGIIADTRMCHVLLCRVFSMVFLGLQCMISDENF